ncbi:MAG: hypothetical protein QOE28_2447 [Solirubrobacteraceae bacterium]|nr:hypothetical protein [Solirubrobacteraceae bacterium]
MELLAAKGVSLDCTSCGRNEWAESPVTAYIKSDNIARGQGFRAYAITCGHCGELRFYDRPLLDET